MGLQIFWFIVITVLWCGFFVLEGFDFGVGMLHWFVGNDDVDRRVAINTIGPFWDGNEVWLIVAGAGIFAAFPAWYATMFSALYLPLVLILIGLIIRGVAFEYRGKRDSDRWRTTWSMALVVGSALVPLLLAVGLGDLLSGLRVNAQQEFTGNFWNLLTAYGLATGVTMLALCLLHGATFLMLKTTGDVHAAARGFARRVAWPTAAIVLGFVIWTHVISGHGVLLAPLQVVAVLAAIAAAWLVEADHEGWAFAATAATILSSIGSIFVALYPNVLVSSTNAAYNLTVGNSASGAYALKVMTVVAVVLFPVVLLYQGWTYYVFRRRVVAAPAAPDQPSEPAAVPAG